MGNLQPKWSNGSFRTLAPPLALHRVPDEVGLLPQVSPSETCKYNKNKIINKHALFVCIATTSTYKIVSSLLTLHFSPLGFSGMFPNHKIIKVICTSADTLKREGKKQKQKQKKKIKYKKKK